MKRRNFAHRPGCAVEATLDLIDGKWKGVILFHLQDGTQRFGELRRRMPGITQRMLTKQLRALEDDRLMIRKVYAEVPPRVEYRLSEIGESLRPVIDTLKAWGEGHQERLSCTPSPRPSQRPSRRPSKRPIVRPNLMYCVPDSLLSTQPATYIRSHRFQDFHMMLTRSLAALLISALVAAPALAQDRRVPSSPAEIEAVLRADRAARAAGGGQRLRRQGRAEPQSAAGRSDLPPLLRRARPAAGADAALARLGRDGRSVRPGRDQQPRHRGRRSGQGIAVRQARIRGRDRAEGQPQRSRGAAPEGHPREIPDARFCQFR